MSCSNKRNQDRAAKKQKELHKTAPSKAFSTSNILPQSDPSFGYKR